ncbi:MerR family transcriptional regulator [Planosporangium sp. 12N6]|uniref:MerR family transcriptional regulator n=1 Tax=Planosporangium spinosum TaxID=3402278 RepID=UPI003CFA2249
MAPKLVEYCRRSNELAAQAGITKDTIRFYEKIGLVTARRLPNGYRDYPAETVPWLRHIRTARMLGFSLAEIARHGERLRDAPEDGPAVSALLGEKVRLIDMRIAELVALRADLLARIGTACPLHAADPTA